jgi:hypothetical protein
MRSRCVIVAGFARSGTSWLGKGLSFAPGFTYYREPDNDHRIAATDKKERFAWLYLTPNLDDPEYLQLMTRACSGQIATAFTMADDPGPILKHLGVRGLRLGERFPVLFCRQRHTLLKLTYANLNLTWLRARFPHVQQVYILRHPCGQFESWQRRGWKLEPAHLLQNRRLMEDHLHPFESLLSRASSFWERAGALWAAVTYVVHRQTQADQGRFIVAYEWLCQEPVARFRELYRRLGLEWSRKAEHFLRISDRPGDTRTYSLVRSSKMQVDVWKARLRAEDIAACRRFVEPFELPYYPGFEPNVERPVFIP